MRLLFWLFKCWLCIQVLQIPQKHKPAVLKSEGLVVIALSRLESICLCIESRILSLSTTCRLSYECICLDLFARTLDLDGWLSLSLNVAVTTQVAVISGMTLMACGSPEKKLILQNHLLPYHRQLLYSILAKLTSKFFSYFCRFSRAPQHGEACFIFPSLEVCCQVQCAWVSP